MRLLLHNYNIDINWGDSPVYVLTVESSRNFGRLVNELSEQIIEEDKEVVLSENFKELSMKKVADFLWNPYNPDFNNNKLASYIQKELADIINERYQQDYFNIYSTINTLLEKAAEHLDYPISYEEAMTAEFLCKAWNVRLQQRDLEPEQRLAEYIQLIHRVTNKKLFIGINLKAYFEEDTLKELYKIADYEGVKLLLIERFHYSDIEGEKNGILDKDGCFIYY